MATNGEGNIAHIADVCLTRNLQRQRNKDAAMPKTSLLPVLTNMAQVTHLAQAEEKGCLEAGAFAALQPLMPASAPTQCFWLLAP